MARFLGAGAQNFCELEGTGGRTASVAVTLIEPPESVVRWQLTIEATTMERGTVRLGRVLTVPPRALVGSTGAAAAGVTPRSPSRVVAIATCVGAVSWKVAGRATSTLLAPTGDPNVAPTPDALVRAVADCTITPSPFGLSVDGVQAVNADSWPSQAPEGIDVATSTTAIVPGTVLVAQDDRQRVGLRVRNVGAAPVWLASYALTNAAEGFELPAGAAFDGPGYRRALWAFALVATTLSVMTEGG